MSRFKNYGLWVSIFAFIPLLLQSFGVNILPSNYQQIVNAFLGILVLSGILSDPSTKNKFYLDDKTEDGKGKEDTKLNIKN